MKIKVIISLVICIICALSYYFIFRNKNLYEGYRYNIKPQVDFINDVLKNEYGNKYKLYTASFNDDDEIPDIGEYNENAILWLGKKNFKITPDLPKNIAKFGKVFCSSYPKYKALDLFNIKNKYQFPIFLTKTVDIKKNPKHWAVIGSPTFAVQELNKNKIPYKKYSFKKLNKLRHDLSEIKAIIIEEAGAYNNYDLDDFFLLANYNEIPIITTKKYYSSDYLSLLGIDAYYYFTQDKLKEIIYNIENNINNDDFKKHNYVKRYLTPEATYKRLKNILDDKDEALIPYVKFNIAGMLGYTRIGDYWIMQDLISTLSPKYEYVAEFENNDYKPIFDINVFVLGTFSVADKKLKSKNNILWLMYPNIQDNIDDIDNYITKLKTLIDKGDTVVTSSYRIKKLLENVGFVVTYIPQFTNTNKFYFDYDENKKSEILFVGNNWFKREIVYMAKKNNLPLTLYGNLFPEGWAKSIWIDNRILRKYYSSAKIVLSDQQKTMKDFGVIVNRVFDATACGTMVVSEWVDEIKDVYGDCVPMYKTEKEFIDIINYYLTHDKEREEKAKCAQKITLENYTSDTVAKKFDALIDKIKIKNM